MKELPEFTLWFESQCVRAPSLRWSNCATKPCLGYPLPWEHNEGGSFDLSPACLTQGLWENYSASCLCLFGLHNIIPQTKGACKTKARVSHSSGGWEVHDQGAGRFGVWWGPAPWVINGLLLAMFSQGRRHEGALWGVFCGALRALLSWPSHLQNDLPLNTITLSI